MSDSTFQSWPPFSCYADMPSDLKGSCLVSITLFCNTSDLQCHTDAEVAYNTLGCYTFVIIAVLEGTENNYGNMQ